MSRARALTIEAAGRVFMSLAHLRGVSLPVVIACLIPLNAQGQDLRACVSASRNYGRFTSTAKVELLPRTSNVKLLEALTYLDPCGKEWVSPAGSIVDGATIPRQLWSIVGSPLGERYRDASIIHDVACVTKEKDWRVVHEAFYFAMLAGGVETWRAKAMYAAVYHFGPRWADPKTKAKPPAKTMRENDLKELAEAIRIRETSPSAFDRPPMSLEDIEGWVSLR